MVNVFKHQMFARFPGPMPSLRACNWSDPDIFHTCLWLSYTLHSIDKSSYSHTYFSQQLILQHKTDIYNNLFIPIRLFLKSYKFEKLLSMFYSRYPHCYLSDKVGNISYKYFGLRHIIHSIYRSSCFRKHCSRQLTHQRIDYIYSNLFILIEFFLKSCSF